MPDLAECDVVGADALIEVMLRLNCETFLLQMLSKASADAGRINKHVRQQNRQVLRVPLCIQKTVKP